MNKINYMALALTALLLAGCAAQPEGPSAFESPPAVSAPQGPNVQTDWSKLGENRPERRPDVGGRWYAEPTDHLIPGPDYGDLIPFAGGQSFSFREYEGNSGQPTVWYDSWPSTIYGLMTREGKVVVDPVYLYAYPASTRWPEKQAELPVLILYQAREEWADSNNGSRYAVAARDGSWVTDFSYWAYTVKGEELMLLGPEGCTRLNSADGAILGQWTWEDLGVCQEGLPAVLGSVTEVFGLYWIDRGINLGEGPDGWTTLEDAEIRVFDPDTGSVRLVAYPVWEEWQNDYRASLEQDSSDLAYWHEEVDGTQLTAEWEKERYTLTLPTRIRDPYFTKKGDLAVASGTVENERWSGLYQLSDGRLLFQGCQINFLPDLALPDQPPHIVVYDDSGNATLYDPDLNRLLTFSASDDGSWIAVNLRDGILSVEDNATFAGYYDIRTGKCIFYRNLGLGS